MFGSLVFGRIRSSPTRRLSRSVAKTGRFSDQLIRAGGHAPRSSARGRRSLFHRAKPHAPRFLLQAPRSTPHAPCGCLLAAFPRPTFQCSAPH